MAQAERWTFKILSLPVFDRTFVEAIAQSPLVNPTFVIALGAESACRGDSPQLSQESVNRSIQKFLMFYVVRPFKLEQFWSLIIASEKLSS